MAKKVRLSTLISLMEDVANDPLAPKNVKKAMEDGVAQLRSKEGDLVVKLSNLTYNIERLTEDPNLISHIRVKLFNILSEIETVKA